MSSMPRDLLNYERIEPPRFKKEYEGQLLRILEMPQSRAYDLEKREYVLQPDPLMPNNTVFSIRRRYTSGDKQATLICGWPCPCCGHTHEREFPESMLAEGKAEFVKQSGYAPGPATILYLASPYTHDDPAVMQQRWLDASAAAAWLMSLGFIVFSPISMGHPVGIMGQGRIGHDFQAWEAQSFAMLDACTHLVANKIDGWNRSTGVRAEINRCRHRGKPVWSLVRQGDGYRLIYSLKNNGEAA